MERCDFANICAIIRKYFQEGAFDSQTDFIETLFDSYLRENPVYFDNGLLNKWLNGVNRLSPAIRKFYQSPGNCDALAITIQDAIIPALLDSGIVVQEIHHLLACDASISSRKKESLSKNYPCDSDAEEAAFMASVLSYGIIRDYIPHDVRKPELPSIDNKSPVLRSYIFDEGLPKPCPFFCGRDSELKALHSLLMKNDKVFLRGIPGIGKSELAKAYARDYKKEYTNILFITYSGDLKKDIASLSFTDDYTSESDDELFRRHSMFLKTMKPDTLLILDNCNAPPEEETYLHELLRYRCRVLITTRCNVDECDSFLLEEISDTEVLFQLAARYYSEAERHRKEIEAIIEIVHHHTFAVELAARLLENGLMRPYSVVEQLERERASFSSSEKIRASKDGKVRSTTYYNHIHALFSLFTLSPNKQNIMRNLTLVPSDGIHIRLFGEWMKLSDLNAINELIEAGFISSMPGKRIALHSMLFDVTVSELPPDMIECHTMLDSISDVCFYSAHRVSYYRTMFHVIENTVAYAVKNDTEFYIEFIEEAAHYMDRQKYRNGLVLLVEELERILEDRTVGSQVDRILLADKKASCAKSRKEAIDILESAIKALPELNFETAPAAASIYSNLGIKYLEETELLLGKQYMETGLSILNEYHLLGGHNGVTQFINYAVILNDAGFTEDGLNALCTLENSNTISVEDEAVHALLLKVMGYLALCVGDGELALDSFEKSIAMYAEVYRAEPEFLVQQQKEIMIVCKSIEETGQIPPDWEPFA